MQGQGSITTGDGSHTLYSETHRAYYHSLNGALTEALHIFVGAGFRHLVGVQPPIAVLEVGLGTGLNAALTASEALACGVETAYTAIEQFPITAQQAESLDYGRVLAPPAAECWRRITLAEWGSPVAVARGFSICKLNEDFTRWQPPAGFNLVYFDAFAPDDQPEMWSVELFQKLYASLLDGGILVTYSSKGSVKRALRAAGFGVERLAGPPGKRHILRACKAGGVQAVPQQPTVKKLPLPNAENYPVNESTRCI